jgi:aminoglycoside phosphotransferase family enzyme/predicted kinase
MELPRLIAALSDPTAYAFQVSGVEVHQTHISAVFLVGPFAYKIKKHVKLEFLDFSTLERRRHFCEEEVRLNRRLAPEVYLGVVPIVESPEGIRVEQYGALIEWAVKMQRLPEAATYQARLRRGEMTREHVEKLALKIAAFHQAAQTDPRITAFGRFERVSRLILDVFDLGRPLIGSTCSRAVFDRLHAVVKSKLEHFRPLIEARSARGITRDCHGDLHLDHVYYFPERMPPADLVIVDCIEFNECFRFVDPVADMAFPFMDLAFWGRRDLASAFAAAYFRASGDEEGQALLPLYTTYRATVRGAVEGILLTEKEVPDVERAAALARSRTHWLLALAELEKPDQRPCLVLVAGLPGTGKSVLARGLSQHAGFQVIRSDTVRKEIAGLPTEKPVPAEIHGKIYSPEWDDRTYAECLARAEALVFEGKRVLVDATFRKEQRRRAFLETAVRWGVPGLLLHCEARPETVRQRLEARRGDASDADWAVHQVIAGHWEEPSTITRQFMHAIPTDGRPEQVLSTALQMLRDQSL